MRAAYVTQYDARNVRFWSGTGYNIAQSLTRAGLELDYIGPLTNARHPLNVAKYLLWTKLAGRNDHPQRDPGFLRHYARQVERRLASTAADVIVAPGGLPLSYLRTGLPVVLWTDCTFANLVDYYPAFSNLSGRSIGNGHDGERRALGHCDLLLFSSDWAARSAIRDYAVDPAKVHVVPLGSNMPGERSEEEIEALVADRLAQLSQRITLFTSGVDWHRKGVDVAVDVLRALARRGIDAELLIAGCGPPDGVTLPANVRLLGFLSKNDPAGVAALARIYAQSHIFLLATRADCTPMVLGEAGSFGLPSLASNTGGISSIVAEGVSGWTFDPAAPAEDWADRVASLVASPARYADLCRSSFRHYRERLTWDQAGRHAAALIRGLVTRRRAGLRS